MPVADRRTDAMGRWALGNGSHPESTGGLGPEEPDLGEPRRTPRRPHPPRWVNTLVRWALRTPGLQRWVGRSTALLTFHGRRSGRVFTTPVTYVRDGDRVLVISHRQRQWWRNLAGRPDVHLLLAGTQHHGRARVLRGLEALDAYLTYLQARPRVARAAGVQGRGGVLDPRRAQTALATTVVVAIDLVPLVTRLSIRINDRG